MEWHAEGFFKCPVCGAEVWPSAEGSYSHGNDRAAKLAQKLHGVWYCQQCRVPMQPIDGDFCKCPHCGTEIWYGKSAGGRENIKELMETTEEFPVFVHADELCLGVGGGRLSKGAARSSSRSSRRKALLRKPSTEQLYRQLF